MFGFFKSKTKKLERVSPRLDLTRFTCDGITLGAVVTDDAFFAKDINSEGVYANADSGIEIGIEDGCLDYLYITLASFGGQLFADGNEIALGLNATEAEVEEVFGQPYHRHVDEGGEVLLFHEYYAGEIGLQFEFPPGRGLGFITFCRAGVLSCEESRKAYGVNREWPPEEL